MIHTKIAYHSFLRELLSLLFIVVLCLSSALAQDSRLARQYYQNGEYEKAAATYQSIFKENPNNSHFFNRYVDCLIKLEHFEEAEEAVKKEIKNSPKKVQGSEGAV